MTGQMVVRLRRAVVPAALVLALAGCGGQAAAEVPTTTVERTPESCIKALDLIQEATGYMADQMGVLADNIYPLAYRDLDQIEANTAKVEALTKKIDVLTEPTRVQVDECRSKR